MSRPRNTSTLAAVVIGRNEGGRLIACLDALQNVITRVIYVDSGSTDGSVAAADARGATVVALDMSLPFTAARARNAGLNALSDDPPEFVQFIDGDCVLRAGWTDTALTHLRDNPTTSVVCGRRRERHPEQSVYNRLCDHEWATPAGKAKSCGGDAMMRYAVVAGVGGFRDDLIAGEEPELCIRLRAMGGEVHRLDAEMTLHDAAMTKVSQWFSRARRAGHAFAEGAALHGDPPERHWVAETRRAVFWGLVLPLTTIGASLIYPTAFWLFLAYPAQVLRLAMRHGINRRFSWTLAFFQVLAKFPEALGVLDYRTARLSGRKRGLIEYK